MMGFGDGIKWVRKIGAKERGKIFPLSYFLKKH
jgi:hypothetical protein